MGVRQFYFWGDLIEYESGENGSWPHAPSAFRSVGTSLKGVLFEPRILNLEVKVALI